MDRYKRKSIRRTTSLSSIVVGVVGVVGLRRRQVKRADSINIKEKVCEILLLLLLLLLRTVFLAWWSHTPLWPLPSLHDVPTLWHNIKTSSFLLLLLLLLPPHFPFLYCDCLCFGNKSDLRLCYTEEEERSSRLITDRRDKDKKERKDIKVTLVLLVLLSSVSSSVRPSVFFFFFFFFPVGTQLVIIN